MSRSIGRVWRRSLPPPAPHRRRGGTTPSAFSPIDLIPDFVPVLGYLDDLILVPLGIAIAITLIPPPVLAESRAEAARDLAADTPFNRAAVAVIVAIWIALAALAAALLLRAAR
jgi:hypothetical protein